MLWLSANGLVLISTVLASVERNNAKLEEFYNPIESRSSNQFLNSTSLSDSMNHISVTYGSKPDENSKLPSVKEIPFVEDFHIVSHRQKRSEDEKNKKKYFNDTISCCISRYSCSMRACSDVVGFSDMNLHCYCDALCQAMNDCCHDYPSKCSEQYFRSLPKDQIIDLWTCVQFGSANPAVWMKTNCSQSWSDSDVYSHCINAPETLNSSTYREFLPVVGADNITYRNKHCAKCNYQNDFEFWLVDVSLDFEPTGLQNIGELIDFSIKYYGQPLENYVVPKKGQPRRYCIKAVSQCSPENTKHLKTQDCLTGDVAIVSSRDGKCLYKNKACAACNGLTDTVCGPLSMESLDCSQDTPTGMRIPNKLLPKIDFSMTINFRNSGSRSGFFFSPVCLSKVYDYYLKKCVDEEDIVPPVDALLDKYRVAVWFKDTAERNYSSVNVRDVLSQSLSDVPRKNIFKATINKLLVSHLLTFDVQLTLMQIFQLSKNYSESKQCSSRSCKIEKFLRPFTHSFSLLLGSNLVQVVKTSFRRLACAGLQTFNVSEYFQIGEDGTIYVNRTKRIYTREDYFESDSSDGVIKVCKKQVPEGCAGVQREYEQSEFEVRGDLSLYHNGKRRLYPFNEYTVSNNSILICEKPNKTTMDMIREYLTWIGLCLSILSLIIVLVTYGLFSKLRTVPGKNIVNLAISLLLFDILWCLRSIASVSRPLCVTAASVLHYLILVSLLSMSMIAHDTLRMFTDPIGHQRKVSLHKYHARILLIWSMSLIFLALCTVLWKVNFLDIEYNDVCWIGGRHQVIVLFAPVCITMTFNCSCFMKSILEMRKLERNGQMLHSQKQEKRSFFIHLKISTLIGLGWTFSFFAVTFPSVSVLWYIFIVFTSFQGVYILLAFVCNQKILTMYVHLWHDKPRHDHQRTRFSRQYSTTAI